MGVPFPPNINIVNIEKYSVLLTPTFFSPASSFARKTDDQPGIRTKGRAALYGVCLARKAPCKEEGGHQSLRLFSGATRKWLPITF